MIEEEEDDDLLTISEEIVFSLEMKNINDGTLDSGATSHVTGNKALFNEITPINNRKVKVANGSKVDIIGKGTSNIQFENEEGEENSIKLADML